MDKSKKKSLVISVIFVGFSLTAILLGQKLYELREKSISPTAPQMAPAEEGVDANCSLSFILPTGTPLPSSTPSPTPGGQTTPTPTGGVATNTPTPPVSTSTPIATATTTSSPEATSTPTVSLTPTVTGIVQATLTPTTSQQPQPTSTGGAQPTSSISPVATQQPTKQPTQASVKPTDQDSYALVTVSPTALPLAGEVQGTLLPILLGGAVVILSIVLAL